jgi:hypothetical protein
MATLEQVLTAIGRLDRARASELALQLGVSQPTVSRLLTAAGTRVCRMGAGRAARYALTRSLFTLGTRLPLHRVDAEGIVHRHGVLHLLARGHHWLELETGTGAYFEGLPPFAADMSPQGYLGRSFTTRYPELVELPQRITDWNDDHRLLALALRGEDCTGDLILGEESVNRFLAHPSPSAQRSDYPELARSSMSGQAGSSAGGEQPKFATSSEGRHVLVKFSGADEGAASRRWSDLLVCESLALAAVHAAGIPAATAHTLFIDGRRFLEVERFDRVGRLGRRPLLSLGAIDDEYFGHRDNWTKAAQRLLAAGRIDAEDARGIRWLDVFGQLIGNTDRHFGNISFFVEDSGRFRLAPAYDMLPMVFAPVGADVIERPFEPAPPTADTLDVWADAARHALSYWSQLIQSTELSIEFREQCSRCREAVAKLADGRVP